MREAVLYTKLDNNSVRCGACRLACVIAPGRAGVCGVRQNISGRLYLLVYGRASAVNIDPVEKKPLFHFLPGTAIFSIGTVGCNFGCGFCQNWDISQATRGLASRLARESKLKDMGAEVGKLGYNLPPEKIVEACVGKGIPSIAYTYNEPSIFFEYYYDTSRLAHGKGIRNVLVTNGYESEESLRLAKPYLDAMNIDLKSFSDEFYAKVCKARLQPVLDTIRLARELGIWVEVTTLVIPGKNDSDGELKKIADFISGVDVNVPWHVTAFHPDYQMKDVSPTSYAALQKAYDIGKGAGLKFVYVGNIMDDERESTCCPGCGTLLVRRSGFFVKVGGLKNGKCGKCSETIPGVWE